MEASRQGRKTGREPGGGPDLHLRNLESKTSPGGCGQATRCHQEEGLALGFTQLEVPGTFSSHIARITDAVSWVDSKSWGIGDSESKLF